MPSLRRLSTGANRLARRSRANLTARASVGLHGGIVNACRSAVGDGARLNVVLVVVDSLRADRVGPFGDGATLTPCLDTLAEECFCFTKTIVQAPWTKPSLGSLFTGLYPSAHGANQFGAFGAQVTERTDRSRANVAHAEITTLSELLAQAGYATAAFTGGGFAHAIYQGKGFQHFYSSGHGLRDLFYQCARWFANRPAPPFFAWLHAYDTHRPYWSRFPLTRFVRRRPFNLTNADMRAVNTGRLPLTQAQLRRLTRLYDNGVRHADRQIGFLLHALRSSGLLEQSILILTSDHGEALYEHQLVEHADVIYNEVLRVPLLVRIPGTRPREVDQYVRLMDLMPTILELAGISAPDMQGVSLLPAMLEGKNLGLTAFSEIEMNGRPRALQATLEGQDYKVIRWEDTGQVAFFNLTTDPVEQHDLSERMGPEGRRLLTMLDDQLEENDAWAARFTVPARASADSKPEVDQEVEQRLRDLGYIE